VALIASIVLCFYKDHKPRRGRIMNILLIFGVILFLSPFLMAFTSFAAAGFQGNIWGEGPGGHGVYLWLYMFILPVSLISQPLLLVLKFNHIQESRKKKKEER
jgi:TRAP-type mannitol/chloroaromatic compound transport system permease small subunit